MTMPSADVEDSDEALAWFLRNLPDFGDERLKALVKRVRIRSAGLSRWAQLDLVNEVWGGISKALSHGTTYEEFRKDVQEKMRSRWGVKIEGTPERLDVIFRTNVQKAYISGRYIQATEPAVMKARPYWKFSSVLDGRTTEVCKQCNGTILPSDHPWWKTHLPPLHYRCRSTFITLSASQAKRAGIDKSGPNADALDGFGSFEDTNKKAEPKPDLRSYPKPLVKWFMEV